MRLMIARELVGNSGRSVGVKGTVDFQARYL